MAQCLIKVLAGFVQELHHTLLTNLGTQCQRVDEHTHSVADAQVGTAVTNGGDAELIIVGKAGQRIEGGCQHVVSR